MIIKLILFTLLSLNLYAKISIPKETKQLLVVSAESFKHNLATLQAYEHREDGWKKYLSPISVNLGRNGLAWGEGLIPFKHKRAEPIKKEGDGKSPAGLFELESFFGYEHKSFAFTYVKVDRSFLCIDDSESDYYNKIIHNNSPETFSSYEYMRRDDDLYKLGIVVGHNQNRIKQGGSCIFIHIQRTVASSTSGCTSMDEERLLELMKWLDKSKEPLLLQLPASYLKQGFN